ncbi:MAG: hypothetical protein MUF48_25250, partial [Pirellulaceae bacterium]|nr:hypothetical protein [Pirellulaceae bacterium]
VRSPLHAALSWLTPPAMVPDVAVRPTGPGHGWLFHLDRRSLAATSWSVLAEAGRVDGFRVRLLETAGRAVHATLRAFRPISAAHRVDFAGRALGMCPVRDGAVEMDVGAHEWLDLEVRW